MARVGPFSLTARNRDQAEYLVRSRAEQRGITVNDLELSDDGAGTWLVTLSVAEEQRGSAGMLGEDTQVLHMNFHHGGTTSAD